MKILHLILATSLLVITVSANANAIVVVGPVINPANGHSYYLLEENNWTDSEAEAITLGGHLATINDTAENDWVYDTFSFFGGIDRDLWIGFTDSVTEGTFLWTSNEPVTYTNWGTGEPNNGSGFGIPDEDFAFMLRLAVPTISAREWNDAPDVIAGIYGVVEVPEPTSAALWLTTSYLFMIFLFKRKRHTRADPA